MKLLIHINNNEIEVNDINKLKEHVQYLSELIDIYENTNEQIVFNIPTDILQKTKTI